MSTNNILQAAVSSLTHGKPISFLFFRIHRLLLKTTTPFAWYPANLKKAKPDTVFLEELTYQLPVKPHPRDKIKEEVFNRFDRLKLASQDYPFDESINWWPEFEDDEDLESLHRWNWLLYMLSSVDDDVFSTLVFKDKAKKLIDNWFNAILNDDHEIFWDAYTVGERLSNIIIFSHYTGLEFPDLWREEISKAVSFVIDHLEYAGCYTGNHVFNNARAVYLAGCAFNQPQWRDFAQQVVLREIKKLLTEDGFLREGSSHYHFLFTRWILELYYFAELIKDEDFKSNLAPYMTLTVNKLWFFLVYRPAKKDWVLPLTGDISPDFTPQWLIGLPWSELAVEAYHPNKIPDIPKQAGWVNIFGIHKPKLLEKWTYKHQDGVEDYESSGWFRLNSKEAVLLWYANSDMWAAKATHGHCDIGSFCFYLNGEPIFIDAGRLNYGDNDWGRYGLSAQAHNTICIDGEGCFPTSARHYPEIYDTNEISSHARQKGDVYEGVMSFEGYPHSHETVRITRRLILSGKQLMIEDDIQGKKQHKLDLFFHFGGNVKCVNQNESGLELRTADRKLKMEFERSRGKKFKIDRYFGGENMHGWHVSEYGQKQPSLTIKKSFSAQLPIKVRTIVGWS